MFNASSAVPQKYNRGLVRKDERELLMVVTLYDFSLFKTAVLCKLKLCLSSWSSSLFILESGDISCGFEDDKCLLRNSPSNKYDWTRHTVWLHVWPPVIYFVQHLCFQTFLDLFYKYFKEQNLNTVRFRTTYSL